MKKAEKNEKSQPISTTELKTKVLKKAEKDARTPQPGNTVAIHYTGWITQKDGAPGRQIDSSIERGTPLEFTLGLGQVIKGFEEGVKLMKIGEKRRLFIPSELGYGEKGIGLFIPPNSDLIFDVELMAIH